MKSTFNTINENNIIITCNNYIKILRDLNNKIENNKSLSTVKYYITKNNVIETIITNTNIILDNIAKEQLHDNSYLAL